MTKPSGFYGASRASIPARSKMWRALREAGFKINSTWIDEVGEGETENFSELWTRIEHEIRMSQGLIFWAEPEDFPLKGALVEVGMALGMGKPVALILPDVKLEARSMRPVGSWMKHPHCALQNDTMAAMRWIADFKIEHDWVTVNTHGHNTVLCRRCLHTRSKLLRNGEMRACEG